MAPVLAAHGQQTAFPARADRLAEDLQALGRPPWPLGAPVPAADGDAAAVGLLYVLEGSRLGGAVIRRRLLASLPPHLPLRFFSVDEDPGRWQRLWDWVDTLALPESRQEEAARAAEAAFALYLGHLDRCAAAGAPA